MKTRLLLLIVSFSIFAAGCSKKDPSIESKNKQNETSGITETVQFRCEGMHCSGCEETITEEVKKLEGISEINADAQSKLVTVKFDNSKTNKKEISKAINAAGYDTELTQSDNKHNFEDEMKLKNENNTKK